MKNNSLYKQLKTIAANYTVAQIELATEEQVCTLLGVPAGSFSGTFFENMKRRLIKDLQDRDDEVDLQNVKAGASTFLDANFPNWQADRGREDGSRFVKIWLEGRPE